MSRVVLVAMLRLTHGIRHGLLDTAVETGGQTPTANVVETLAGHPERNGALKGEGPQKGTMVIHRSSP
jgi:hypothetical protein